MRMSSVREPVASCFGGEPRDKNRPLLWLAVRRVVGPVAFESARSLGLDMSKRSLL